MNRRRTFFVRVKTQFENLGDAVIVGELVRLLSRQGPVVVSVSLVPEPFVRAMRTWRTATDSCWVSEVGTPEYVIRLLVAAIGGMRPCVVLMPGGVEGGLSRSRWLKAQLLLMIQMALRLCGVRFIQLGVSYDRLTATHAEVIARRVRGLAFHAVREQGSRGYALQRGVRVDAVLPDLAFSLFEGLPSRSRSGGKVGLSFRVDKSADARGLVLGVAPIVARLYRGRPIVCIVQVKRDVDGMRDLHDALIELGCSNVELALCSEDIDRAVATYDSCDLVLSNRLHVLLLALSRGARVVPLLVPGTDGKIERVWGDLRCASSVQYLGQWTGEDPNGAEQAYENAVALGERLRSEFASRLGAL